MDGREWKILLFFIIFPIFFYLMAILIQKLLYAVVNAFPQKKFSQLISVFLSSCSTKQLAEKLYLIVPIVLSISLVIVTFYYS